MIIHYLQALRLADDVTNLFDQGSSDTMQDMDEGRIQVLLKALIRQLNNWKNGLPPKALEDGQYLVIHPVHGLC